MRKAHERVVITGIAASSCCGLGVGCLFETLRNGLRPNFSERAPSGRDETKNFKRLPRFVHGSSELLRKTRTDDLPTCQLVSALEHDLGSQLSRLDDTARARTSVVIGTTSANYQSYRRFYEIATQQGWRFVNPVHFPTTLLNYSAVQVNSAFRLTGSSTTISSGSAAGVDAIGYAALRLQLGRDDAAIAGGIGVINDCDLGLLERNRAVSESLLIRPFHRERDGTIPGEGIGVLLLESLTLARREKTKVFGEVLGYGSSNSDTRTEPEALRRRAAAAIDHAVRTAELELTEVDAIFPSANGTVSGDELEGDVLRDVFGSHLGRIPVYPLKTIIGECFTASGPLQCIAATYAITEGHPYHQGRSEKANVETAGLIVADVISKCNNALVYSFGLDHAFSALIIGTVRKDGDRHCL